MYEAPVAVIGATGTTGSRIVRRLTELDVPVRPASRSGPVRFDWHDETTYRALVEGAAAVYLLPPVGEADPAPPMRRLVETALAAGVRRLVLHSATIVEPGTPGIGEVHALIAATAPEWAVVRPSWFMQNLQGAHYVARDIREHGLIRTSVGDGRIAFVDADDIAAVAVHALTDAEPHQRDHLVTGPEALSYDDVAAILSRVSGRSIRHERIERADVERLMIDDGMTPEFASFLAGLEDDLREGSGSAVSDDVRRVTGRGPRSLADWAGSNAESWRAAS